MKKNKIVKSLYMSILVVSIQLIYSKTFGPENILIGVIMAIGAATFINKSLTVRPIYKASTILLLNLVLGICGYIASLNIYTGLIVNIITIFFVTYLYMNDFSPPTSYIFLMGYIFIWASSVDIYNLPKRLLALSFGVFIIIFLQWIFNRHSFRDKSKASIIKTLKHTINEIEGLVNGNYEYKESISINNEIREIMLLINGYSFKKFYSSKEGKLMLSIAISLERLNLIANEMSLQDYDEKFVRELQMQLVKVLEYLQNNIEQTDLIKSIDMFLNSNKEDSKLYKLEVLYVIEILRYNIIHLNTLTYKDLKAINKEYKIPKEFTKTSKMKRNLSLNSVIFTYSIKQAFLMSIAMFLSDYLGLAYGKWIVLTMYVIMQPYAEDTIIKSKKRFKGTILGILLFFIVFSLIKNPSTKYIVLLGLFFFYFYYDEYSKKVMCLTVVSLTSVSLVDNINILTITRLVNVAIGIIIVLIINKYVFPYNVSKSIEDLKKKYDRVINVVKKELKDCESTNIDNEKIIKLILLCNQIESKLIANNKRIEDKSVEVFIFKKNTILSDLRFLILQEHYYNKSDFYSYINKAKLKHLIVNKIENM